MEIVATALPEVKIIRPRLFQDARGGFFEAWNARAFAEHGIAFTPVQQNCARSGPAHVLRGLHYQLPPAAQAKLVRVTRGRIVDVVVDIRRSSPRFGRHALVMLDADDAAALFVPAGFAHGYLTLEPDSLVDYLVDAPYAPAAERGIAWNDPDLGIDWPLGGLAPVLSPRDADLPPLSAADVFA
jgi:dTDP-4-dehydrorhamnose 3,5-epimerase